MANELERQKSIEQIVDSARDLYSAKITLPLGNPNLKLVHTNQMLFTQFSEDVFELANFDEIASAMNSTYVRFGGYVLNRWYVETCNITNNGKDAKMELEINPFPSTISKFKDERSSFLTAYTDAKNEANNSNNSSKNTVSTKKTVKSVKKKNTTLKGGQGKFIDNLVKKTVGKQTDPLKKAKLIDKAFKQHVVYSYYKDPKHTCKSLENGWKKAKLNCADSANILCAMFLSAGISSATIIHTHYTTGHYIVRIKINGKYYYTDNAAGRGRHTKIGFNHVWGNVTKGSKVGTRIRC